LRNVIKRIEKTVDITININLARKNQEILKTVDAPKRRRAIRCI